MHLHANEIRNIRENLCDFVTRNKVTFILPKSKPLPEGPYIDTNCVTEVMISAASFKAAVDEFHHAYLVQIGADYTVEFIGNDLRHPTADPHLICK